MYGVTDAFLAAIVGSHTVSWKLDIYQPTGGSAGYKASSRPNAFGPQLTVLDGEVTGDWQANVVRTFRATLADPDGTLLPLFQPGEDLSPLSRPEVDPYRGVLYDDGTEELVPLGRFFLEDFRPSADGLKIEISGRDYSGYISENKFRAPYVAAATTTVHDTTVDILAQAADPYALSGNAFTSVKTLGSDLVLDENADPWAEAQQLLSADGFEVLFDHIGLLNYRKIPDPAFAVPVFRFGPDHGRLLQGSGTVGDIKGLNNGVLVRGNAPWLRFPVQADVYDNNPASPTYYLGPFGKRPKIVESAAVGSDAECLAMATGLLSKTVGFDEQGTFTGLVNPALDAGDVVTVTVDGLLLDEAVCTLDTFTIPLLGGRPMQFTTRRRRAV